MRLTCPNCAAEYEIADDLVPAEGRDVECSNCGQVWFQAASEGTQPTSFDPLARPALNRQLNESMLAVLREEAARELGARAAEREGKPVADPAGSPSSPENDTVVEEIAAPAPYEIRATDWPATTITDDLNVPATAPEPRPVETPAEEAPMVLPDAQVMAATLTTTPPAPPPAPVAQAPLPVAIEPQPTIPPSRKSYWNGFNLAVLIAALLVLAYVAAPHFAAESPVGQKLMAWRETADQGRAWLYDHATGLFRQTGE